MSEWQPIETAPRDGTVILVALRPPKYKYRTTWGAVRQVKWLDGFWKQSNSVTFHPHEPTDWTPLPEPPK